MLFLTRAGLAQLAERLTAEYIGSQYFLFTRPDQYSGFEKSTAFGQQTARPSWARMTT